MKLFCNHTFLEHIGKGTVRSKRVGNDNHVIKTLECKCKNCGKIFYVDVIQDIERDYYKEKSNTKDIIKVAWNSYFKSYIKVVKYVSDKNWYFILCDANGNVKKGSQVIKATSNYDKFNWFEYSQL